MEKSYSSNEANIAGWLLGGTAAGLTVSFIFWYLDDPQQFIEHRLGINAEAFQNITPWLLAFMIIIGYVFYTVKAVPFVQEHFFVFSGLKMIGIWSAFVLSTMEEIVFRQMFMDWLQHLNQSLFLQILGSAILFGVAHGAWVLLRREMKIALPVIVSTTVLGGLLAILYIAAGRNLLAPIVTHIAINVFIEPWLILSSITGKWKE